MLEPDSAHNNAFDAASSRFFYHRCQELAAPLAPFPDPLGPFPDPSCRSLAWLSSSSPASPPTAARCLAPPHNERDTSSPLLGSPRRTSPLISPHRAADLAPAAPRRTSGASLHLRRPRSDGRTDRAAAAGDAPSRPLGHISAASRPHLRCTSAASWLSPASSRLYLGSASPPSRPCLGCRRRSARRSSGCGAARARPPTRRLAPGFRCGATSAGSVTRSSGATGATGQRTSRSGIW